MPACQDNVYGAVIVTYSHCESSPGSSDEFHVTRFSVRSGMIKM